MYRYAAFLRGINVGGRIIKMGDLKACFEAIGLTKVTTLLQSGNVVFEGDISRLPQLKTVIETAVTEHFLYPAKILVYTIDMVEKMITAYPFDTGEEAFQHYVVFLENGLESDLADLASTLDPKVEKIEKGNGCLYWMVQKGMTIKSDFSKYLTKAKYKDYNTVRNINTLQKIVKIQ